MDVLVYVPERQLLFVKMEIKQATFPCGVEQQE